jgi:hypothetical protein
MAALRESTAESAPRSLWRDPVFFLHIPKVAGTSVRHHLEGCLYPHERRRVTDVNSEVRAAAHERLPVGVKFVSGHLPLWYREAFKQRARTLIILRHPVERALSTYRFWKGLPPPTDTDGSEEAALLRAVQRTSLEEFALNQDGVWWGAISNYATWLVGHNAPWDLSVGFQPSMTPLARRRLQNIEMIGLTERLSESMQLISDELGLPYTRPLPSLNVSSSHSEMDRVPASIARALTDANEHDLTLWDDANRELDRRLPLLPRRLALAPMLKTRFSPLPVGDHFELSLGNDPVVCEGWLPPERDQFQSWRFAAAPGPAELYVQWPSCNDPLALVIESPFAAPAFDYNELVIHIDGHRTSRTVVQLSDRTLIVTAAISSNADSSRTITFSYPDPCNGSRRAATHDNQIAFAVTSITWTRCPDGDWDVASHIGARLSEEVRSLHAQSIEQSTAICALEEMIVRKDEYIQSLLQLLEDKDEQSDTG